MPTKSTTTKTDVSALAYILAATEPELFADHLPGESEPERAARQQAARDITEALLAEAAHDLQDDQGLAVVEQIVWPSELQDAAA